MRDTKRTRMTRQKEAVMRTVLVATDHPTADEVFMAVRKEIPKVSLGTVYRILGTLVADGRLRLVTQGAGPRRYDPTKPFHAHVVCERCGAVADVPFRDYEDLRMRVESATGFRVADGDIRWSGLCPSCKHQPQPTANDTELTEEQHE